MNGIYNKYLEIWKVVFSGGYLSFAFFAALLVMQRGGSTKQQRTSKTKNYSGGIHCFHDPRRLATSLRYSRYKSESLRDVIFRSKTKDSDKRNDKLATMFYLKNWGGLLIHASLWKQLGLPKCPVSKVICSWPLPMNDSIFWLCGLAWNENARCCSTWVSNLRCIMARTRGDSTQCGCRGV